MNIFVPIHAVTLDGEEVTGYSTVDQGSFSPASAFYRTLPEFIEEYQTKGRLTTSVPVAIPLA